MEAVTASWIHYVSPTFICFVVALLLAKLYIKIRYKDSYPGSRSSTSLWGGE